MNKNLLRPLWLLPPVVLAVAVGIYASKLKTPPQTVQRMEKPVAARVVSVVREPLQTRVTGYGSTRAATSWEAVAQVAGQVEWVSEELKPGRLIKADTEVLRIDATEYALALAQIEAQLNLMSVKQQTIQASLALEEKNQSLLRADVERKRKLRTQGTLAASEFEEAERNLLRGEQSVQTLKNSLMLNEAETALLASQKTSAELDIQRCRFVTPFDLRVTELKIHQWQYANKGQLLFSADGLDAVEVNAQFPIGSLRSLMLSQQGKQAADNDPGDAVEERTSLVSRLDATLRLNTATHKVSWQAEVDRVAAEVDAQTQTIGVVVRVDQPYDKAKPGVRPPLVRNTFVEVELAGKKRAKMRLIPLEALHDDQVYLVDKDNRVVIRDVKIAFRQGRLAVVADGLEEGDTVVVSSLPAVTEGMLLDPKTDARLAKRIKAEANNPSKQAK